MGPVTTIWHNRFAFQVWEGVYEPAEDSFMLLDAALGVRPRPAATLEIGTGCGLIAIMISMAGCPFVVATDVSPQAIRCARANAMRLGRRVHFLASDVFSALRGSFDLILFNPPYLPVHVGSGEHVAWAGGKRGRELIDRFIAGVAEHLKTGGSALLVESSLSSPEKTIAAVTQEGLGLEVLSHRAFFFESLRVVRLFK